MMRFTTILVGLVVLAALAAGGCGGGSNDASGNDAGDATQASKTTADAGDATTDSGQGTDSSGQDAEPSGPLTKAQLIKQGDAICQEASEQIVEDWQKEKTKYGRGFGAQPNKKQNEEGLVDLVLPVIQKEAEELAELDAAASEEGEIAAIAAALEEGVSKTEAQPSLAEAKGAKNPLLKASKLSQQYGFKVCGS